MLVAEEFAVYKYFDLTDADSISVTVRGKSKGKLLIQCEGESVATITLKPSKDWTEFTAPLKITPGRKALTFTYQGVGYADLLAFTLK